MLFCNLVFSLYFIFTILTLVLILTCDYVNGEVKGKEKSEHFEDSEKVGINDRQSRVLDAIDDKEWHVKHLKDMDFETDCEHETFNDKVKKYRQTLRNDGALVEFVSADAIPVNKEDLATNKCKSNWNRRSKNKNKENKLHKLEHDSTGIGNKEKSASLNEDIKPATVSVKDKVTPEETVANRTNQRRSEYQFSSVEYYDEFQDFNADVCPDTVEVIELELDTLRSYDVVCEATLEWRSLE